MLDRRDTHAILPTGYGKSIIYQVLPSLKEELNEAIHGEPDMYRLVHRKFFLAKYMTIDSSFPSHSCSITRVG